MMERSDAKLLPLFAYGITKGILEEYVAPVVETYRPKNVEEVVETVGLVVGLAGLAISACAVYKELRK